MQLWLDGVLVARGGRDAMDLRLIQVASLAGIEIYRRPTETPSEFTIPSTNCGALILWTRDR